MKCLKLFLLFCLLMVHTVKAQEVRSSLAMEFYVKPKLDAEFEFQMTKNFLSNEFSKMTYQGKLDYSLNKRWKLSGSYSYSTITQRAENMNEAGDETFDKQKFSADLIYQPKRFKNDFKLSNRLRYQFATVDNSKSKNYIRNKITLDYKISKNMLPYIAFEPYFNLKNNTFKHLRFYIGTEFSITNNKIDVYYIKETTYKEDLLSAQNIIGINFKLDYNTIKSKVSRK